MHPDSLPMPLPIRRADHSPIRGSNRHNNGTDASCNSSTSAAGSSGSSSSNNNNSRGSRENRHHHASRSQSSMGGDSDGYDDGPSSPAGRGGEQQYSLSDRKNETDASRRHGGRAPRPWTARSSNPPRGRKIVASSLEKSRRAGGIGGGSDASVYGEAVPAAERLGRSSGGRSAVERGLVGVGESLLRSSSSWSAVMSLPTLPNGLVGGEAVPALLSHLAGRWRDFVCCFCCCRCATSQSQLYYIALYYTCCKVQLYYDTMIQRTAINRVFPLGVQRLLSGCFRPRQL